MPGMPATRPDLKINQIKFRLSDLCRVCKGPKWNDAHKKTSVVFFLRTKCNALQFLLYTLKPLSCFFASTDLVRGNGPKGVGIMFPNQTTIYFRLVCIYARARVITRIPRNTLVGRHVGISEI